VNFDEPVAPVLIAGIGNILLGDDGFGPQAIARLQSEYEFGGEVELLDLGTPALDFVDYLAGRKVVVLLDALSCGGAPGEVLIYDHAQLRKRVSGMRLSAHQPCLDETLFAAETAGVNFEQVTLIGIVADSLDVGTELSPTVSSAMPQVLQLVCEIMSHQGVNVRRRETPIPQETWWNKAGSSLLNES